MNPTRRTYLKAVSSVPLLGAAAGCLGDDATGSLATRVTDQPGDIADFESCVVTVVGTWLGSEDADSSGTAGTESGEREYYECGESQEADLVQLQGEETQLVDERELDVATYAFLQLDTDGVDATLAFGRSVAAGHTVVHLMMITLVSYRRSPLCVAITSKRRERALWG